MYLGWPHARTDLGNFFFVSVLCCCLSSSFCCFFLSGTGIATGTDLGAGPRLSKRETLINNMFDILNDKPTSSRENGISVTTLIEHLTSGRGNIHRLCLKSSFLKPLVAMGSLSAEELESIIVDMDSNSNGYISKKELNQFLMQAIEKDQSDVLKQLFLMVDTGEGDDDSTSSDGQITLGKCFVFPFNHKNFLWKLSVETFC